MKIAYYIFVSHSIHAPRFKGEIKMDIKNKKIAFIGYGGMGGAMIEGLISSETVSGDCIIVINDAAPERASAAAEKYGVLHGRGSDIAECDIVVFAVKPQVFPEALEMYGKYFASDKLYLSIMAGVSTESLEEALGGARVIRFMPNLALSVGESATVYALGKNAAEEDADIAETMFSPMGLIRRIDEDKISAVTALSGSGPAYFCALAEAMTEAAVDAGMDRAAAVSLAVQTMIGTAEILKREGTTPDELRRRVTSKKGTTEAALDAMAAAGFAGTVKAGFEAARLRSDELGRKK